MKMLSRLQTDFPFYILLTRWRCCYDSKDFLYTLLTRCCSCKGFLSHARLLSLWYLRHSRDMAMRMDLSLEISRYPPTGSHRSRICFACRFLGKKLLLIYYHRGWLLRKRLDRFWILFHRRERIARFRRTFNIWAERILSGWNRFIILWWWWNTATPAASGFRRTFLGRSYVRRRYYTLLDIWWWCLCVSKRIQRILFFWWRKRILRHLLYEFLPKTKKISFPSFDQNFQLPALKRSGWEYLILRIETLKNQVSLTHLEKKKSTSIHKHKEHHTQNVNTKRNIWKRERERKHVRSREWSPLESASYAGFRKKEKEKTHSSKRRNRAIHRRWPSELDLSDIERSWKQQVRERDNLFESFEFVGNMLRLRAAREERERLTQVLEQNEELRDKTKFLEAQLSRVRKQASEWSDKYVEMEDSVHDLKKTVVRQTQIANQVEDMEKKAAVHEAAELRLRREYRELHQKYATLKTRWSKHRSREKLMMKEMNTQSRRVHKALHTDAKLRSDVMQLQIDNRRLVENGCDE